MLDEFGLKWVIDILIVEFGFVGIGVGVVMNGLWFIVEFMIWNFVILVFD